MEDKKEEEREKKKVINGGIDFMLANTPDNSPVRHDQQEERNIDEEVPPVQEQERPNMRPSQGNEDHKRNSSPQAISGKKRRKRKKAKAYRTIDNLKEETSHYKALWETMRKRIQRMKKASKKGKKIGAPKTKRKVKPHRVPVVTKLVRKIYKRTGHSVSWNVEMRKKIRRFLEEDINSSQAPGKKETVTRGKIKMQKRYLNDTLLNLYKGFIEKYPDCKLSYTSFCRLRPFWVVQRKVDSRETCLCKVHENVKYRVLKLHRLKIINESNPDKVAESLVCDVTRKECAHRECRTCQMKELPNALTDERAGEQVTYYQWVNRTEEISTKTGSKTVTKTLKVLEQSTIETLLNETATLLREKYVKHIFNIRHQYKTMKELKDNITERDAVIHVDFSENFNCKLAEEIQSMHFGGSRNQISLHTVVVYTKDKIESFCTVSENTQHGPAAIWAHMKPVLDYLKEVHGEVTTVHFLSDGPCTQYRSKVNFFLFNQEVLDTYHFELATWNFTESGHGKSAADGIGGTVKRTADRLVANGIDIPDAKSFCTHADQQLRNVRVLFVEDSEIERKSKLVPSSLQTVKGTMKLHQVGIRRDKKGILNLKVLSCFCRWPEQCTCYILSETPEHHLPAFQGTNYNL